MLLFLSPHRDFDSLLEKYISTKYISINDLAVVRAMVIGLKIKVRKARNVDMDLNKLLRTMS